MRHHVESGRRIEVPIREPILIIARNPQEILGSGFHLRVVIEPTDLQRVDRRSRSCVAGFSLRLITEASALLVIAALHVSHRVVDGLLGHVEPAVLRGT